MFSSAKTLVCKSGYFFGKLFLKYPPKNPSVKVNIIDFSLGILEGNVVGVILGKGIG